MSRATRLKGTVYKGKVKCRVCTNEKDGFCLIKKCHVKLNKARICDGFNNDFSKVKIKEKVPTVMRPDWYWKRKEVKRAYKMFLKNQEEQKQFSDTLSESDAASPDCLAGFRSTAGDMEVMNAPDCLANIRTTSSGVEEKNES